MNANDSNANLIFRDRPLSKLDPAFARRSSLPDACREQSDGLDALLRVTLVLCMLVALLICGWHVDAALHTDATPARPMVAAQGFSVHGQHVF